VRRAEGGTGFVELDATPIDESQMVPVPVPRGSLVVLHGLLPHRSSANLSAYSREAYTLHFVERAASYPENNWLRPATESS
jgi:phytanoyl-CoA hydroxylase